ncbi:hypothetical protein, partial [Propionibacterium acidifaciens]|uniref:hypothetical protein n=1 Tax=Propionibacterium acidifaciens TaxID=556499 RepID=UPI001E2F4097
MQNSRTRTATTMMSADQGARSSMALMKSVCWAAAPPTQNGVVGGHRADPVDGVDGLLADRVVDVHEDADERHVLVAGQRRGRHMGDVVHGPDVGDESGRSGRVGLGDDADRRGGQRRVV